MIRIYHHWEKWECAQTGFFETDLPSGYTPDSARIAYRDFLADIGMFSKALDKVICDWPISCEQFLSNESMNRIAWLGQASMYLQTRVPMWYRGGFNLLSPSQQRQANKTAEVYLKQWIKNVYTIKSQSIHRELETMRLF